MSAFGLLHASKLIETPNARIGYINVSGHIFDYVYYHFSSI